MAAVEIAIMRELGNVLDVDVAKFQQQAREEFLAISEKHAADRRTITASVEELKREIANAYEAMFLSADAMAYRENGIRMREAEIQRLEEKRAALPSVAPELDARLRLHDFRDFIENIAERAPFLPKNAEETILFRLLERIVARVDFNAEAHGESAVIVTYDFSQFFGEASLNFVIKKVVFGDFLNRGRRSVALQRLAEPRFKESCRLSEDELRVLDEASALNALEHVLPQEDRYQAHQAFVLACASGQPHRAAAKELCIEPELVREGVFLLKKFGNHREWFLTYRKLRPDLPMTSRWFSNGKTPSMWDNLKASGHPILLLPHLDPQSSVSCYLTDDELVALANCPQGGQQFDAMVKALNGLFFMVRNDIPTRCNSKLLEGHSPKQVTVWRSKHEKSGLLGRAVDCLLKFHGIEKPVAERADE